MIIKVQIQKLVKMTPGLLSDSKAEILVSDDTTGNFVGIVLLSIVYIPYRATTSSSMLPGPCSVPCQGSSYLNHIPYNP
jgi:hypothetical protein